MCRGVQTAEFRVPGLQCYDAPVSVFKRGTPTHVHIRTSITVLIVGLLVVLLSAVCYYRVGAA